MSLTNLLAKIAGRHQVRKADFKSLVKAVADGQEPDLEHVERVLAESGKTLEDLQHAAELYLKRRALKGTVDQQPKLQQDREQIEKQISQDTTGPIDTTSDRRHFPYPTATIKR